VRDNQEKRVTLAQVAARAGVSVMTASYTYNQPERVSEASRSRVLAAAAELGYPGPDPSARSLRSGSTGTIGIVLGEHLTYAFDDRQATAFLAGIAEVCAEHAYGMTILPIVGSGEDEARVRMAAVDAFIVWTVDDTDPVMDALLATRRPVVVHGGPERDGARVVTVDNAEAARALATLALAGARRPAVLSFPVSSERRAMLERGFDPAAATFPVTRARLAGFRTAVEEAGLAWGDVLVSVCSTSDATEAESAVDALLSRGAPPDALLAMSDELASAAVRVARRRAVAVPHDLAIVGFDDGPAALEHDLTTVHQSLRAQGAACAGLALGIGAPDDAAAWSIVRRGSTR
jgi:DNA-binding LacI/PurR family transcriptional regulator